MAAAVTRISDLEQACEEASGSVEAAQARLAELAAGEPSVRGALADAEEDQRALLADLGAQWLAGPFSRPSPRMAKRRSAGERVRRDRGRGAPRQELAGLERPATRAAGRLRRGRAAAGSGGEGIADAERRLAVAWTAVNDEAAEVARLTAEIGPLAEAVALARQRWAITSPRAGSGRDRRRALIE